MGNTTLGKRWSNSVAQTSASISAKEVQIEQEHSERVASHFFTKLRALEVRDGIESCVANGSTALAIPAPYSILGTRALAAFVEWAADQDLALTIGFIRDEVGEEGLPIMVVSLCPLR